MTAIATAIAINCSGAVFSISLTIASQVSSVAMATAPILTMTRAVVVTQVVAMKARTIPNHGIQASIIIPASTHLS
ncbi:hypothetical protein [Phytobacter diazotrophicus]|uniref:hypothetical protein n=1 Tax=Phytobacter diazotrophicus TaxID=395631 RepID=UPI003305A8B7